MPELQPALAGALLRTWVNNRNNENLCDLLSLRGDTSGFIYDSAD